MRRISSTVSGGSASQYRPLPNLPEAERLRQFASACHHLAERETDAARRAMFQEMESAWEAVAAQVERADDLVGKMRATQCQSRN